MLAKVPTKRKDGKSSFADLIRYTIERDKTDMGIKTGSFPLSGFKRLIRYAARQHGFDEMSIISILLTQQQERVVTESGVVCQHNCDYFPNAAVEMQSTANLNVRVKDPVYHAILSWQSDEQPSDEHIFASGLHAMQAVGMADHQYVFAIHRDTDNIHLHMTINRVHPDTLRAVYPDRDFYKLDYAMRELELRFNFKHDPGPYSVFERDGKAVIDWTSTSKNSKEKMPSAAADMEAKGEFESLYSYARGEPRQVLLTLFKNTASTWQYLHQQLYRHGLAIREKGQGFAIYDLSCETTTPVKASDLHENLSKKRLLNRYGAFEEFQIQAQESSPPGKTYDKFKSPKRDQAERDLRSAERAVARKLLYHDYQLYKKSVTIRKVDSQVFRIESKAICEYAKTERIAAKTNISDLNKRKNMYSLIAYDAMVARQQLRLRIQQERQVLKDDETNRRLNYEAWVKTKAQTGHQAAISQLRAWDYAKKRKSKIKQNEALLNQKNGITQEEHADPVAMTLYLRNLFYRVQGNGTVVYQLGKGSRGYSLDAFVDHGRHLTLISDLQRSESEFNREAVIAMIHLAAEKFAGRIEITGSDEFIEYAIQVIAEEKIHITLRNPRQAALFTEFKNKIMDMDRQPAIKEVEPKVELSEDRIRMVATQLNSIAQYRNWGVVTRNNESLAWQGASEELKARVYRFEKVVGMTVYNEMVSELSCDPALCQRLEEEIKVFENREYLQIKQSQSEIIKPEPNALAFPSTIKKPPRPC